MNMTSTTTRPVFAVRLDRTTGDVREGFDRLDGTASTREEAIEVARAAGLAPVIDGGDIDTIPAEVVGEERDVWGVTVEG
jgi:hypothetical protein